MIVYDTTCVKSFEDIDKFWFNEIESYADKDIKFLLLGNKSDIDDKKQVQTEKVNTFHNYNRSKSTLKLRRWTSLKLVPKLQSMWSRHLSRLPKN